MKYEFDAVRDRKKIGSIKWRESGRSDVLEMGTADMDFRSAPEICEAFKERAELGDFGYFIKSPEYYKSIIDWNRDRFGWELSEEQISNCPGVIPGITMCIRAFSEPGDAVPMDAPSFSPIKNVTVDNGRRFVKLPLTAGETGWSVDFEAMEKTIAEEKVKIYVLINPQNPTGKVYTKEELAEIGRICDRHGVLVISDEVHGNILYDAVHIPYTKAADINKKHGIVITSVTKGWNLQGLCYGIVIAENEELMKRYNAELHNNDFDYGTNVFSMTAVEAAYTKGREWLAEANSYLRENRDYAASFINEELPGIKAIPPQASYLMWMDCSGMGMSDEELERFFPEKCKVGLNYGYTFEDEGKLFVRTNFACPRSILKEALERIKAGIGGK